MRVVLAAAHLDGDPTNMTAAARLRELGYDVLEAADGPMALRIVEAAGHLDLLITDVELPGGLNGRQVAEAVRSQLGSDGGEADAVAERHRIGARSVGGTTQGR